MLQNLAFNIKDITAFRHVTRDGEPLNREFEYELITYILQTYNLRISEVLSITELSIIDSTYIYIEGKKRSADYIIREKMIVNYCIFLLKMNNPQIFTVTYQNYYRYLSKTHPELCMEATGHNRKVTHSFRYRAAQSVQNSTNSQKAVKLVLNHNSVISQKYYLRKEKTNGQSN